MKKTLFFTLAAIAFLVLPSAKLLAQAEKVTFSYEDIGSDVYPFCDGNPIDVQWQTIYEYQVTINNNRVSFLAKYNGNITGVDQNGNTYTGFQSGHFVANQPLQADGTLSVKDVRQFQLISQGSVPNIRARLVYKLTVNPDGTVTVERESLTLDCN